jgi:hypothetical protein
MPSTTDPHEPRLCTLCDQGNAQFCGRCKSACYCSKECQKADWSTHKLLCTAFSKFDVSGRPTDEHVRAVLFPVNKQKPQLIWLHCKWHTGDYGGDSDEWQFPNRDTLKVFLGPDTYLKQLPVTYNSMLKRGLRNTVNICYRDTFFEDGSVVNSSVAAITTTKPGQYHEWRGAVIAYGKRGSGMEPHACKDLDMSDFRHITDYFLSYCCKSTSSNLEPDINFMHVKGVKINCIGDEKMFNKPHFEAIDISATDRIFTTHETSDIANRIGLPIFTRHCVPDAKWANDLCNPIFQSALPFDNQDATFLHLCCDPDAESDSHTGGLGWAWASQQWQKRVGSIIVVRQDRKPLLPLHVEVISKYCRHEIRPLLAHSIGEYMPDEPMERDAVLAMICRPTFVIHWYKLLEEKRKEGAETNVPFPYDI